MYITWKYDTFPYMLCGKVTKTGKTVSDFFSVEGYEGLMFKPVIIMADNKRGEQVKQMIESIRSERDQMIKVIDAGLLAKLNQLINGDCNNKK